MIRASLIPIARAAWTNSRARNAMNSPRTSRATAGHETSAIAMTMVVIEGRMIVTENDREDHRRDGLEHFGHAHQQVVDQAAVVAGQRADDQPAPIAATVAATPIHSDTRAP
jgi:hypothetical protein